MPAQDPQRDKAAYSLREDALAVVGSFLFALSAFLYVFGCQLPPRQVATPTFSPYGGEFVDSVHVAISHPTIGATIRYAKNHSDPTGSSPKYAGPIRLTITTTLKARAFTSGMTDSKAASDLFSVNVATKYGFVTKWCSFGDGDGEFKEPIGLAIDSQDRVYVADAGSRRIQKFAPVP